MIVVMIKLHLAKLLNNMRIAGIGLFMVLIEFLCVSPFSRRIYSAVDLTYVIVLSIQITGRVMYRVFSGK